MNDSNSLDRAPATEADIEAYTLGGARRHDGPVLLAEYDVTWPDIFAIEEARIRMALGDAALSVEHVGSTAVPGLAAKPIIDILLEVADSSNETSYVIPLESHGYELRVREPAWWEHRVLKSSEMDVNLHVFSVGCPEVARMLRFRDRLRANSTDRKCYEVKKRELAMREWKYIQYYADAKTGIIEEILTPCESGSD